jgi:hypothetical protein
MEQFVLALGSLLNWILKRDITSGNHTRREIVLLRKTEVVVMIRRRLIDLMYVLHYSC